MLLSTEVMLARMRIHAVDTYHLETSSIIQLNTDYLECTVLSDISLQVLDIKFQFCSLFDVVLALFIKLLSFRACSCHAIHHFT